MNFPQQLDSPLPSSSTAYPLLEDASYGDSKHPAYDQMISHYFSLPPDAFSTAPFRSGLSTDFSAVSMPPPPAVDNFNFYGGTGVSECYGDNRNDQRNDDMFPMTDSFMAPVFSLISSFDSPNPISPSNSSLSTIVSQGDNQLTSISAASSANSGAPFFFNSYPSLNPTEMRNKSESTARDNALQLFTASQDVLAHPSLQFPPTLNYDLNSLNTQFPVASPRLNFEDNSLLSPIIKGTAQLSLAYGLPSPPESCCDLSGHDRGTPTAAENYCSMRNGANHFSYGESTLDDIVMSTTGLFTLSPELSYPSPSSTPVRSTVPLHQRSRASTKAKALKRIPKASRSSRAAVIRHPSYCEPSDSPSPKLEEASSFTPMAYPGLNDSEYSSDVEKDNDNDICKYGTKVFVVGVPKWKCSQCSAMMGRRPDLHRHYKACVRGEKYHCDPVLHADGSVWPGCGMQFSRRDACHRHLKKRFSQGHCSKTRPKQALCRSQEEYDEKVKNYGDMLTNSKWRAALPAHEKNRLVKTALSHIKQDIF